MLDENFVLIRKQNIDIDKIFDCVVYSKFGIDRKFFIVFTSQNGKIIFSEISIDLSWQWTKISEKVVEDTSLRFLNSKDPLYALGSKNL